MSNAVKEQFLGVHRSIFGRSEFNENFIAARGEVAINRLQSERLLSEPMLRAFIGACSKGAAEEMEALEDILRVVRRRNPDLVTSRIIDDIFGLSLQPEPPDNSDVYKMWMQTGREHLERGNTHPAFLYKTKEGRFMILADAGSEMRVSATGFSFIDSMTAVPLREVASAQINGVMGDMAYKKKFYLTVLGDLVDLLGEAVKNTEETGRFQASADDWRYVMGKMGEHRSTILYHLPGVAKGRIKKVQEIQRRAGAAQTARFGS